MVCFVRCPSLSSPRLVFDLFINKAEFRSLNLVGISAYDTYHGRCTKHLFLPRLSQIHVIHALLDPNLEICLGYIYNGSLCVFHLPHGKFHGRQNLACGLVWPRPWFLTSYVNRSIQQVRKHTKLFEYLKKKNQNHWLRSKSSPMKMKETNICKEQFLYIAFCIHNGCRKDPIHLDEKDMINTCSLDTFDELVPIRSK